ncbi:patatin-like protein 2 [Amaranthus tricolor]|uniref:patatin-like protein 2 n=1 Tax=Amaranthus tricolor TaxID=29722 RepID=UPI00258C3040|nr:patatin-like protein 2 [Amaranthus tricolor]
MAGQEQLIPQSVTDFSHNEKMLITILSIDGGGVRGLISAVILTFLEQQLQQLDGPNARIADYFDVIARTSTGGLVLAAMLTAPNPNNRPLYRAQDIIPFYLQHSPQIFPQPNGIIGRFINFLKTMMGPKYDGICLHNLIRQNLTDPRLHQTLTNLVIPTFDVMLLQPVIFSSFKIPSQPSINAKLSDICIGGSAAPTYLPSYYFKNDIGDGNPIREFNLIDGGIVNNNPDNNLSGEAASIDISTSENLNNLVNIGTELLSHQASRVDPETGNLSPIFNMGSNRDVLISMAQRLSEERNFRMNQN